jgi:hypothetical protein
MNEYLGGTLLENGEEELGAEYERWLDEVEAATAYRAELTARGSDYPYPIGMAPWEGVRTIFIDDFPVREEEEEDDLVY